MLPLCKAMQGGSFYVVPQNDVVPAIHRHRIDNLDESTKSIDVDRMMHARYVTGCCVIHIRLHVR